MKAVKIGIMPQDRIRARGAGVRSFHNNAWFFQIVKRINLRNNLRAERKWRKVVGQ
jgi:hypothetical protein